MKSTIANPLLQSPPNNILIHRSLSLPASFATWVRIPAGGGQQAEQQHQLPDLASVFVNIAISSQKSIVTFRKQIASTFKKRREVLFGWRRRRHGSGGQTGRSTRAGRAEPEAEEEGETVEFCVSKAEQRERAVFLVVCVFVLKISTSAEVSPEMDRELLMM